MSDRMTRIRNKTRELAPWFFIGAGGYLVVLAAYKTTQAATAKFAEAALQQDGSSILVLQEVPAHEAGGSNDVYEDLDNPGMYYEVQAL